MQGVVRAEGQERVGVGHMDTSREELCPLRTTGTPLLLEVVAHPTLHTDQRTAGRSTPFEPRRTQVPFRNLTRAPKRWRGSSSTERLAVGMVRLGAQPWKVRRL